MENRLIISVEEGRNTGYDGVPLETAPKQEAITTKEELEESFKLGVLIVGLNMEKRAKELCNTPFEDILDESDTTKIIVERLDSLERKLDEIMDTLTKMEARTMPVTYHRGPVLDDDTVTRTITTSIT